MSLAVLAQDMASKGRNGDSMLVHMTPGEVAGLQALAMKHGGSLSINPETGLHEANFLKSLLPMLAGFALGPAGFGLVSSALGAGAVVGGITGLATGSLSKGLMAGLGAYGGFGLGESLMSAGTGSLAASDVLAQQAAGSFPTLAEGAGAEQIAKYATDVSGIRDAALSKAGEAGFMKTAEAGLGAIANNPAAYGKDLLKFGAAAATPVLADQMVQTTTKAPVTDTGNIRKFSYDPYSQRYAPQGVFPAAGYKGMADGGIVALAGGFTPQQFKEQMYAGGVDDTAATRRGLELASQAGLNAQQTTDLWNEALGTKFNVDDYSRVAQQYGIAGPQANVDFVKGLATNDVTAPQFLAETTAKGLSQQDVNAALLGSGLSKGAQFALTNQNIGSEANTSETYGGLKGLSNNINYWLEKNPGASAQDIRREMAKYDLTDTDFIRATGTDVNKYAMGPITEVQNLATGAGGNTAAVVNENGTITQTALGNTNVITTVKKDDAGNVVLDSAGQPVTETKVMPTTTMENVRDLYTAGGGSTGYTPKAPINMAEFNTRFNTLTPGGDSEAAYKYLMGQGAYPTKSNVGEIMKPYSEAVLGVPQDLSTKKYLYDNKTRKMVLNPDYVPMSFDTKGVQSFGMSQADIGKYLKANNTAPDTDVYAWAAANKVSPEQIAAALGADPAVIRAKWAAAIKGTTGTVSTDNKTVTVGNTDYSLSNPNTKPPADSQGDWKWVANDTDGGGKWERAGTGGTTGGTTGVGDKTINVLDNQGNYETATLRSDGKYHTSGGNRYSPDGVQIMAAGGATGYAMGGLGNLGGYSDGGRLLKGPGDGVSDSIPATIGQKQQPARLADGEFVIPARIVSELGNGSTDAGAKKLYAMMDRVQRARGKTTGKNKVAANSRAEKYLPA